MQKSQQGGYRVPTRAVWPALVSVGLFVSLLVAPLSGGAGGQLTLFSQLRFDDNESGVSGFVTAISEGETVLVFDYVSPEQGVHVFDVSQPDAPSRISHFPLKEADPSDYLSTSLSIANDKLLIQTTERGLLVVNSSRMEELRLVSRLASPGPEWWGSEVVASESQVLAFYWHEGQYRFEGFIRQFGMNVDGTLDPIQDYSLGGRPVEAAAGHGKLYVVLWKAMHEYSLLVWTWGNGGKLTVLDEVPLNETVDSAIRPSDRFVAVGFGTIAIFRPTAEGVELLDSGNVPGGGIHALVWLDTELVAVTNNGVWSHQVNGLGELSDRGLNRWIVADDGASVQDALVVVNDQGLTVVGREPAIGNPESLLLALVALTAVPVIGAALWIGLRRKLHGR